MKEKRLPIIITGMLLVAVLSAACSLPGATTQNRAGQTNNARRVVVSTGTIDNRIIATGQVTARASAALAFSQGGTIKSVLVKDGDAVKAGQPLATLDTTNLELSTRQQYAAYLDAQAAYSQTIKPPSQADLDAAQAGVISAQEAYSTALKGATPAQYGAASEAIKSARAALTDLSKQPSASDVAAQQAALQSAEVDLQQKQAAYDAALRRRPGAIGASPESLALQQSKNNYDAAKAAYDKLFQPATISQVAAAQAAVTQAQANYANLEPTAQKIAAAGLTLAQAQATLQALTPTNETIIQAKAKLDQAEAAWQMAQNSLKDTTLTAPYDGIVTSINFDAGNTVGAGTNIMNVADFTVPQFQVNVDEADLGNVKPGDDAFVQLQTYPNIQIPAKVETVASAGTTSGNIITFKVMLGIGKVVTGTQPVVLIGMSGTSQIVTAKAENALVVPSNALIVDPQTKGYSVQVVGPNGTPQQVPVKIGFRGSTQVQILSGVSAGDVLVIPSASTTTGTGGAGGGPGGGGPGPGAFGD